LGERALPLPSQFLGVIDEKPNVNFLAKLAQTRAASDPNIPACPRNALILAPALFLMTLFKNLLLKHYHAIRK
jgi:hypothetical protein